MLINKETVAKLKPHQARFDKYLEIYPSFNGRIDEFLSLDKVDYHSKLWLGIHLLNPSQLSYLGILCAHSVLHVFEDRFPEDSRVRECIEYLRDSVGCSFETSQERVQHWKNKKNYYDAMRTIDLPTRDRANWAIGTAVYACGYKFSNDARYCPYLAYKANPRAEQERLNLQFLEQAFSLDINNKLCNNYSIRVTGDKP